MRFKIIIIGFWWIFQASPVFAQSLFSKDSVCSVNDLKLPSFLNHTDTIWDLDASRFHLMKESKIDISNTYDAKLINDNGNWYAFLASWSGRSLYRLNYGNSLNNTPVFTNFGNLDGKLLRPYGIDLVQIDGVYYGVIVNFDVAPISYVVFDQGLNEIPKVLTVPNSPNLAAGTAIDLQVRNDSIIGYVAAVNDGRVLEYYFPNKFTEEPKLINFYIPKINGIGQDVLLQNGDFIRAFCQSGGRLSIEFQNPITRKVKKDYTFNLGKSGFLNLHLFVQNDEIGVLGFSAEKNIFYARLDTMDKKLTQLYDIPIERSKLFGTILGIDLVKSNDSTFFLVTGLGSDNVGYARTYFFGKRPNSNKIVEYTALENSKFIFQSDTIFEYPVQKPEIIQSSRCLEDSVIFYDRNTNQNVIVKEYNWTLNDISMSIFQNEYKTKYLIDGENDVKLKITDICDRVDSVSKVVFVSKDANVQKSILAPEIYCTLTELEFKDQSGFINDELSEVTWKISGDTNLTFNGESFKIRLTEPSNYQINQSIITESGCTVDTTFSFDAFNGPKSSFSFKNQCLKDSIVLQNESNDNSITSFKWEIKGKSTVNQTVLKLLNDSISSYSVSLETSNAAGCKNKVTNSVEIYPLPIPAFDSTYLCQSQENQIFNRSSISNGTALKYQWKLIDSIVSSVQNPLINPGVIVENKKLKLIVESTLGCKDSTQKFLTVQSSPKTDFIVANPCLGKNTTLSETSTSVSPLVSRVWNVNQAQFTNSSVSLLLGNVGKYPVSLTSQNSFGCRSTKIDTVEIKALPIVDFVSTVTCVSQPAEFTSKNDISNNLKQYQWSFLNEGQVRQGEKVFYTFERDGSQLVQLEVVSDEGCKNSVLKNITVPKSPLAFIGSSESNGEAPFEPLIKNLSIGASSYLWYVNGIKVSESTSYQPKLDTAGEYKLQLVARSISSCSDSSSVNFSVISKKILSQFSGLQLANNQGNVQLFMTVQNLGNLDIVQNRVLLDFGGLWQQTLTVNQDLEKGATQSLALPLELDETQIANVSYICAYPLQNAKSGSDTNCIKINSEAQILSLSPIPSKDYIEINLYLPEPTPVLIEVFSTQGKLLFSEQKMGSDTPNQLFIIPLYDFDTDILLLKVTYSDTIFQEKIYKIR